MRRSRRVPVRDWMSFRGGRSVVLLAGPLAVSYEQLMGGLAIRASLAPPYFGLQSFDPANQRLRLPPSEQFPKVAGSLASLDPRPMDDPVNWATEIAKDADPRTLVRWYYRDGYVACVFSHMIADGRSGTRSFAEILLLAQGEDIQLSSGRPHRLPVARAALRTYVRHPKSLSSVVAIVRPRDESADEDTGAVPGARSVATPPVPTPSVSTEPVIARSVIEPHEVRGLDAWGRQQNPTVRMPAALVAGFCAALRKSGFKLSKNSPYVVWDVRRYANIRQLDATNLVGGVALGVPDPTNAQQVGQAMRRNTEDAVPLAGLVTTAVYGWRDRRADYGDPSPQASDRATPRHVPDPMPALSVMTDPLLEQLHWTTRPEERTYISFINTCEPAALPFFVARIDDVVHLTGVCRPDVFEPARIQRALDLLATEPLDLIAP